MFGANIYDVFDEYETCWRCLFAYRFRSRRREVWHFLFAHAIVLTALEGFVKMAKACDLFVGMTSIDCLRSLFQIAGAPIAQQIFAGLYALYNIFVLLPLTALWARRLHDIGLRGWFVLLGAIPVLGMLFLLIVACIPGQKGENRWGFNPKELAP